MNFFINLNVKPRFNRYELLLHPPIPLSMHGVNPRTIMGKQKWDEVRREAYDKNNDCCWICGVHRSVAKPNPWLEAHETYNIDYEKFEMTLREIVALCPLCHMFIHRGRLELRVKSGDEPFELYNEVRDRAYAMLNIHLPEEWWNESGINRKTLNYTTDWRKWHLLYEGRKHFSRFMTPADHRAWYAGGGN